VALLVPLLNPYGLELYAYPFHTMGVDISGLVEWTPPTLSYKLDPLFLAAFALIVALTDFPRVRPRDALLAAAFTALGFSATRHAPFWFIVVIPLLSPYMTERAGAIVRGVRERLRPTALRGVASITTTQLLGAWIAVALIATGALWVQQGPSLQSHGWSLDPVVYPSDAVLDYLRVNGTTGTYTHYNVGGYLIYNDIQPFIDSRTDIYCSIDNPGETSYEDVRNTLKSITLQEFITKYGLKTLVVPPGWSFDLAMRDNNRYELVFSDPTANIYRVLDAAPSPAGP
jgi:hypothetical protein